MGSLEAVGVTCYTKYDIATSARFASGCIANINGEPISRIGAQIGFFQRDAYSPSTTRTGGGGVPDGQEEPRRDRGGAFRRSAERSPGSSRTSSKRSDRRLAAVDGAADVARCMSSQIAERWKRSVMFKDMNLHRGAGPGERAGGITTR